MREVQMVLSDETLGLLIHTFLSSVYCSSDQSCLTSEPHNMKPRFLGSAMDKKFFRMLARTTPIQKTCRRTSHDALTTVVIKVVKVPYSVSGDILISRNFVNS